MEVRETPTFNVKAVAKETGVKPDTLRAWERRYGMPKPSRSQGGHRLYSGRDVDTVKWLAARQKEGLSISNAVDLWRQLSETGDDPLQLPQYAVTHRPAPARLSGESMESIQEGWIAAVLEFDEANADRLLNQAFAIYPVETVLLDILWPALSQIGKNWYEGSVSVQQEHFASELSVRRLEALIDSTAPSSRRERMLLACPPQELHSFPLLVLALLLRRRGWPIVLLGANVPLAQLRSALEATGPDLVIATAQQFVTAASLREMSELLQTEKIPLAFGGGAFLMFPELQSKIAGYYLGDQIAQAPSVIENLVAHPQRTVELNPVDSNSLLVLRQFRTKRMSIESRMAQALPKMVTADPTLKDINAYLGDGIVAGLSLGDLDLLQRDLHWVQGLVENHIGDTAVLSSYLQAYAEAVEMELGEDAGLIVSTLQVLGNG